MPLLIEPPMVVSSSQEKKLQMVGVEYQYVKGVLMDKIDEKLSLLNQAREVPILDDVVKHYAACMANGDEFPALIAYQHPETKLFVLLDGNQRFQASKMIERSTVDLYLALTTNAQVIDLLTKTCNAEHGQGVDRAYMFQQAIEHCERFPTAKMNTVAQMFQVAYSTLERNIWGRRCDQRLVALGQEPLTGIAIRIKELVGSIRDNEIMTLTAALIRESRATEVPSLPWLRRIRAARSQDEAKQAIMDWRNEPETKQAIVTYSSRIMKHKPLAKRIEIWQRISSQLTTLLHMYPASGQPKDIGLNDPIALNSLSDKLNKVNKLHSMLVKNVENRANTSP